MRLRSDKAMLQAARSRLDDTLAAYTCEARQPWLGILLPKGVDCYPCLASARLVVRPVRRALRAVRPFHPAQRPARDAAAALATLERVLDSDGVGVCADGGGGGGGGGGGDHVPSALRRAAGVGSALAALERAFARVEVEVAACEGRAVRWFHEVYELLWCLCWAAAGLELLGEACGSPPWLRARIMGTALVAGRFFAVLLLACGALGLLSAHRGGLAASRRSPFAPRRWHFAAVPPRQQQNAGRFSSLVAGIQSVVDPMGENDE